MCMSCQIEMYCIVNLAMMRNSLPLLRPRGIRSLLLHGRDLYIFSMLALEKSNLSPTLDVKLLASHGINQKIFFGLEEKMVLLGTHLVDPTNSSAIPSNFEENVQYRGARTEIFSEIVAISAGTDLSVIDATGEIHSLSNLEFQTDEIEHSPTLRQVNGAIKGLRLIRGHNVLAAKFFTWTGHRVCFLDEQQCLKTIDLDDSGNECPEIECAAFCPERGLLIIGDNYRTLRYSSVRDETD